MKAYTKMRSIIIMLILFGLGVGGCTGQNGGGRITPKTFVINPNEVTNGECLSLDKLLSQMKAFPENTQARKFTTSYGASSVFAGHETEEISLAKRVYQFDERGFFELLATDFDGATQPDCKTATLVSDTGLREDYQIESASPIELSMKQSDNKALKIKLLGPQAVEVTHFFDRVDICNTQNPAPVHVSYTYIMKWGGPEVFTIPAETVSTAMIKRVSRVVSVVPESLNTLLASSSESSDVTVTALDLRALYATLGRTEELMCNWGGGASPEPPASDDLPEPTPVIEATSSPAPSNPL